MAGQSEAYKHALEAFKKVKGKDFVPQELAAYDTPKIQDLRNIIMEDSWGKCWSRPGLDLKNRSFICMAITACVGTEDGFKSHVQAALNLGITKDELVEMLIQFAAYLGVPKTSVAQKLVREVWKEVGE